MQNEFFYLNLILYVKELVARKGQNLFGKQSKNIRRTNVTKLKI